MTKLEELVERARQLRGDVDRLVADLRRERRYGPDPDEWKAEQLADAIDSGIRAAEGRE